MQKDNINPGFKPSPLGPIPNDWKLEHLAKYGTTFTGLSGKTKEDFGFGKPYIPYLNIFNNTVIKDGEFDLVKVDDNETQSLVKNGDVFFTTSSETPEEVGMCSVYDGHEKELYLNSFCFGYRPYDNVEISSHYIAYIFRGNIGRRIIYRLAQGATRYNLSKTSLLEENIPLPPLPEQQKIADILSTWDEAISKTQQLINQLKERNRGLQQQLLTGRIRVKGFNGSWRSVKLGDVTRNFSRRNNDLVDARIYSVTNTNGFVLQSDHFEREVAGDDLSNYKIIKKNEFAYNPARINVGSIAHFKDDIGVISSLYVCFSTTEDLSDAYLSMLLRGSYMKQKLNTFGEGGVRIYLWYPLFEKIKIRIPSIEEQNAIMKILGKADTEVKAQEQKLETLKQQKNGLMQKLLTGKIRVIN